MEGADGGTVAVDGGEAFHDAGIVGVDGGEGSSDAGAGTPPAKQELELCVVANDDCDGGLLCLPSALNPGLGVCRYDCARYNDEGQAIDENPDACPSNRSCLVVTDPSSLEVTALACLPQASTRDGTCLAPGDEDACAAPMECHVTYLNSGEFDSPTSFNCKLTCDLDASDDNDGCPGDESCFPSSEIQGFEADDTGTNIKTCTLATCEDNDAYCECSADYKCIQLTQSAEGKGGCILMPGVCGTGQRGAVAADFDRASFADIVCDGVEGHTYCDNREYEDLEDSGNICVSQGHAFDDSDYAGICFGFCSTPSIDMDNDGALQVANAHGDDENGETFQCPTGQSCYTDVGYELLLAASVEDDNGPFGVKACNPANCMEGRPCPAECGPGDTQCVSFDSTQGEVSLCLAAFGNCEPTRAISLDGSYDVRMQFDLGNSLPAPYENYLQTLSNMLVDPAGYAVYQTLRYVDQQQGYEFVTWDSDDDGTPELQPYEVVAANPTIFNMWRIARDVVDTEHRNTMSVPYDDLATSSNEIREALTEFEVGSRFRLEPASNSTTAFELTESWQDLVFEWSYGCVSSSELGCVRRLIEIEDTIYTPMSSTYGATATHAPSQTERDRFRVQTEPRAFGLRYGEVMMIGMNELILPSLSNGEANDLEEFSAHLIDCGLVAAGVYDAVGLLPFGSVLQGVFTEPTLEGMCGNAMASAASAAEEPLGTASLGGNDVPQLIHAQSSTVADAGVFYIEDRNHNAQGDSIVDLVLQPEWSNANQSEPVPQTIEAPVLGEGRRMASGCSSDASCPSATSCLPLPHYMQIQAVEMSCESPIGVRQGTSECTVDADCRSGLCVGASQSGVTGTCFSACTAETGCSVGTCVADGAGLDLEETLAGLGSVTLDSCL